MVSAVFYDGIKGMNIFKTAIERCGCYSYHTRFAIIDHHIPSGELLEGSRTVLPEIK
jgi:hypothetical protein